MILIILVLRLLQRYNSISFIWTKR